MIEDNIPVHIWNVIKAEALKVGKTEEFNEDSFIKGMITMYLFLINSNKIK